MNLAGREPSEMACLRELLDDHRAGEVASEVKNDSVRIDPQIAERLRAMGYLQK